MGGGGDDGGDGGMHNRMGGGGGARRPAARTALAISCLCVASRAFGSFPRSGNTPQLSRPTTLRPAIASALALSPSVRMREQSFEREPPALFASSSFGMPT